MTWTFKGSHAPTIGVEIELQLIDPVSFHLIPVAQEILRKFVHTQENRITPEIHQSMIEVNSGIARNVKESSLQLKRKIIELNRVADKLGILTSITGTHPFQKWSDCVISQQERYQGIYEKYQWLARRMNVYGTHVHIGVQNEDQVLFLMQRTIRYLPHLLALSANSPFWQGMDTGMKSSRISIMESFPFAGLPPFFTSWNEFIYYCQLLKRSQAISSIKDLYWHVRPNLQFGTIEFRICDAMTNLSEIMAVTAFIQCLVVWTLEKGREEKEEKFKESFWLAPENIWVAARDGLEGEVIISSSGEKAFIKDEIRALVHALVPFAKDLGCLEELNYISTMIEQKSGADRQREYYREYGSIESVAKSARNDFLNSLEESMVFVCKTPL